MQALRIREFELALDAPEPYEEFRRRSEQVRETSSRCPATPRRRQEDPRLRRLDEGQHDPPVRGHRHPIDGRRPQPRQVGLGDDRHAHPDHQRGGSRAMNPDYYLVLPGTSSTSSSSVSRSSSSQAASSSCHCPKCGSSTDRTSPLPGTRSPGPTMGRGNRRCGPPSSLGRTISPAGFPVQRRWPIAAVCAHATRLASAQRLSLERSIDAVRTATTCEATARPVRYSSQRGSGQERR